MTFSFARRTAPLQENPMSSPAQREIERQDADKVEEAVTAIQQGQLDRARRLLEEVKANTPSEYAFQYEEGDALVMKFWDQTEFVHYVTRHKDSIKKRLVWRTSAYPRAHYYLGFLEVKAGNYARAVELLDAGERLEPNPHFLLEKAQAYLRGFHDHQRAIACYEEVLEQGGEVSSLLRAVALRGKGFVLIEMDHLDEAEACFRASLHLDPSSQVARNELTYIARLRAGGRKAPPEIVTTGGQKGPVPCSECGKEFTEGKVMNVGERLVYLCQSCYDKRPRK
jgi:tetratricopeptide (TPR) repeat protein